MRASGRMLERSRCGCLSKEQEDLQRNRGKPKPWDRTVLKTQMKKTLRQSLEFSDCEMWRTQGDPDQANQKAHLGISLKYMTREISPISRKHTAIHQNKTERLKKKEYASPHTTSFQFETLGYGEDGNDNTNNNYNPSDSRVSLQTGHLWTPVSALRMLKC